MTTSRSEPSYKLLYRKDHDDSPVYEVEVFGLLRLGSIEMVVFRANSYWLPGADEIGHIRLLPIDEFRKRFAKYKKEQQNEG